MLIALKHDFQKLANAERAQSSAWFFKTGKGQYGFGDVFIGVTVPEQRKIAKKYRDFAITDVEALLNSPIHEYRLTGCFILVDQFKRGDENKKKSIFDFYLSHLGRINNWDLVDSSAPYIAGSYLLDKDRRVLYRLAKSSDLWEKRVAVLATFWFIKYRDFDDALAIAEILILDKHDLIQKAVGWMLREIGNRDLAIERAFLDKYAASMPRTCLRYAIEKFEPSLRMRYLKR